MFAENLLYQTVLLYSLYILFKMIAKSHLYVIV